MQHRQRQQPAATRPQAATSEIHRATSATSPHSLLPPACPLVLSPSSLLVNRKCNSMHLMLATPNVAGCCPPAALTLSLCLFYEFAFGCYSSTSSSPPPRPAACCLLCLCCLPNPCKQVKNVVKQTANNSSSTKADEPRTVTRQAARHESRTG